MATKAIAKGQTARMRFDVMTVGGRLWSAGKFGKILSVTIDGIGQTQVVFGDGKNRVMVGPWKLTTPKGEPLGECPPLREPGRRVAPPKGVE